MRYYILHLVYLHIYQSADPHHSWFRHPSYAGFYYWALGTQLVLQNPISFVGFSFVLWRFFYYRTRCAYLYL